MKDNLKSTRRETRTHQNNVRENFEILLIEN